jgi:hypothetical protein
MWGGGGLGTDDVEKPGVFFRETAYPNLASFPARELEDV